MNNSKSSSNFFIVVLAGGLILTQYISRCYTPTPPKEPNLHIEDSPEDAQVYAAAKYYLIAHLHDNSSYDERVKSRVFEEKNGYQVWYEYFARNSEGRVEYTRATIDMDWKLHVIRATGIIDADY